MFITIKLLSDLLMTLFFCPSKEESFLNLNHILTFFEAMLCLKISKGKRLDDEFD